MTTQPLPDPCADTRLLPMVFLLLACAQKQLEDCGFNLCWIGPQVGEQPDLSYVFEDGSMAWVRLTTIQTIESQAGAQLQCATRISADLELGFATCYVIDNDGKGPNTEEAVNIFTESTKAMLALRRAILCCDWAGKWRKTLNITDWEPIGPSGGIVGGTWGISVEF